MAAWPLLPHRSFCRAPVYQPPCRLAPHLPPSLPQEGDSTSKKLSGALLNALIFISVVAAMTFILVLLFKYGCVKLIYGEIPWGRWGLPPQAGRQAGRWRCGWLRTAGAAVPV